MAAKDEQGRSESLAPSLGSAFEPAARTASVVTQYRPETPFSCQDESK
jgi:hypothetical protein